MIHEMARSQLRQRDKLVARAESVRASIAADVVAPLSLEIATLQAELHALSDAVDNLARQGTHDDGAGARPATVIQATASRDAPVVFLHVPKTAGTTVTIWLRLLLGDLYSKAASYSAEPAKVRNLAAALQKRPGSVEVVAGHLPYSTRPLFAAGSRFFTFLRDPIDRAMSHFYYFRERVPEGAPAVAGADAPGISLEQALASWDASSPVSQSLLPDNLQTRMLSGFDPDAPASPEMLEAAKRNLWELDVVGLTERFHESVALLHLVYGWRLFAIPSRRVRTHRRPAAEALAAGELQGLRRLNALDEALYAEGTRVFAAAQARFGERLALAAAALERARELNGETERRAGPEVGDLVQRRAAEILADTQAALDEDLLEQAHGLAMTLVPHTTAVGETASTHLRSLADLTRQLTELVRKQQARM